jgi:hypothetical protein
MAKRSAPEPPEHLAEPTAVWWRQVAAEFDLEEHHRRLLTAAGEAWDRHQEAREALAESPSMAV